MCKNGDKIYLLIIDAPNFNEPITKQVCGIYTDYEFAKEDAEQAVAHIRVTDPDAIVTLEEWDFLEWYPQFIPTDKVKNF